MAQFYAWLGARKSAHIQLAVIDMWKPIRLATQAHAPQAAILFDKFHVMRHLGEGRPFPWAGKRHRRRVERPAQPAPSSLSSTSILTRLRPGRLSLRAGRSTCSDQQPAGHRSRPLT